MFDMPVFPLSLFQPMDAPARGSADRKRGGGDAAFLPAARPVDLAALPIGDALRAIIITGGDPKNPDRFPSRSEAVYFVTCELIRCGVPEDALKSILLDRDLGISAHVLEKGRIADGYADRQIQRAKDAVQSDFHLDRDEKIVRNSQHNIRVALARLGVTVWFDAFRARIMIEGLDGHGPGLDDAGVDALWLTIDAQFGFRPTPDFFFRVLRNEARTASRHPVREYLDGLRWDGVFRVDTFLTQYGGAPDTAYVRALSRLMLLGAVHRIRQPGSKLDEMLVIEGQQGGGKSTMLKIMAVRDEWFGDELPISADTKRIIEAISGKMIVEVAELKGVRRSEAETLKAVLSRQVDEARMSYDRAVTAYPRQVIFVGTTNSDTYLRDTTGNRRFLPVRVTKFDLNAVMRDRDQIWAEAAKREADGEDHALPPELYDTAAAEQEERRSVDPFFDTLNGWLRDLEGAIRAEDVAVILGKISGQRTQDENQRIGEVMRMLGFIRAKLRFGGKNPENCYVRGDASLRIVVERDGPHGVVIAVYNDTGVRPISDRDIPF